MHALSTCLTLGVIIAGYTLHSNWKWITRVSILYACLSLIFSPGARAILGPDQENPSQRDHVCVHTRLIDEVYEWKIQRSMQLVREMGADTIVEFFPWAYIEYQPGRYNWEQADKIMRHAQNQDISVIARMGLVPPWIHQGEDADFRTLNDLPVEAYDDFAVFTALFAERYAGIVNEIIIWNEPNLSFEWGYRPVDPVAYTDLLRVTYRQVKERVPNVSILAGALAPTIEPPGSPNGMNDLIYLERMYEAGAAAYFDALAVHTYGFNQAAEAPPDAETLNFRRAELLRELMTEYDDPDKPVYITESGWNDHPRWVWAVRPSQRAQYTVDAFDWAETQWPWLDKMCIWAFRYPAPTLSYPDYFTLVTPDFQLKPIYYAIRAYALRESEVTDLWLPAPADS